MKDGTAVVGGPSHTRTAGLFHFDSGDVRMILDATPSQRANKKATPLSSILQRLAERFKKKDVESQPLDVEQKQTVRVQIDHARVQIKGELMKRDAGIIRNEINQIGATILTQNATLRSRLPMDSISGVGVLAGEITDHLEELRTNLEKRTQMLENLRVKEQFWRKMTVEDTIQRSDNPQLRQFAGLTSPYANQYLTACVRLRSILESMG